MSRAWLGLFTVVAFGLIVAVGFAARGKSSLVVVAACPVIWLLGSIGRRLWEFSNRDLDAVIAVDIEDLAREFAAATKEAYRPDMTQQTVAMIDDVLRKVAETQGVAHDPNVAAKLSVHAANMWHTVALSHASTNPGVQQAKHNLQVDLLRKQAAEHPFAHFFAPVGWLLSEIGYNLLIIFPLLGSIGFGGLLGFGLAELYYAGGVFFKILAGIVAATALLVVFPAMKVFGMFDLRGWLALFSYAGAAVMISLHVGAVLHWPWWGGPLVGILFIAAGLTGSPPSAYGAAASRYSPLEPPSFGPPGVGIFPRLPPH
jgi:hypothetical protein